MTHENSGRSYARKENVGISLAYQSKEEDRLHSAMVMWESENSDQIVPLIRRIMCVETAMSRTLLHMHKRIQDI